MIQVKWCIAKSSFKKLVDTKLEMEILYAAAVLEGALYLSGYDLSCELSDLSPRKPITLKSSSSPHSKRWLHRLESLSLVSLALQSKYYWDVERKEKRSLCHTHANTSTCDKFLPVEFQSHFTLLGWAAELGHFVNPFYISNWVFFWGFISIPGASILQKMHIKLWKLLSECWKVIFVLLEWNPILVETHLTSCRELWCFVSGTQHVFVQIIKSFSVFF